MSGGEATEHICGVVGVIGVFGVATRLLPSSTIGPMSRVRFGTRPYRTAEKKDKQKINEKCFQSIRRCSSGRKGYEKNVAKKMRTSLFSDKIE